MDLREDRAVFYLSLANGQMQQFNYRAKGTAAGTYTTPPAFGESMYDRAVKARANTTASKPTEIAVPRYCARHAVLQPRFIWSKVPRHR